MLKWMKVRQNASAMTPTSSVLRREAKGEEVKIERAVRSKEEEEDSGMEREDTVTSNRLEDLKKVRLALMPLSALSYIAFKIYFFTVKVTIVNLAKA